MAANIEEKRIAEFIEIRDFLESNSEIERKRAAKRVLSLLRSGENVRVFFSSMLKCVKTNDIELKKLVYHYLVTYSSIEPEQSIMAVNTFINDSRDSNPLIRALAIRTMCRINIDSVAEHMVLPLKTCLHDSDPYVRKTAALGVAKLFDIIPDAVESSNIFESLLQLLKDENPMVISNTVTAISEINERRLNPAFQLNENHVQILLNAMKDSSNWVQALLLDSLSKFALPLAENVEMVIEQLIPYLRSTNPSVIVGSFKVIFQILSKPDSGITKSESEYFLQIIPPFLSLVSSSEKEIQYVVLRTISLFIQKYPSTLTKEIRLFFCKYNDPSYIKIEKLSIIVQLCVPSNVGIVLDEIQEYCNFVDVSFVKKAIISLGVIALRIESASRRCVDIIVKLIESKAEYSIEESIIVFTDILRKYPGHFESIISKVCSHLDNLKDSRAKSSAIWIIGEYCDLIESVDLILDPFIDSFFDDTPEVQVQLLTALVKVYLSKPEEVKDQIQYVLNESIKETMLPDIRNRGLIYWRLLSAGADTAKSLIVFPKTGITYETASFSPSVLKELLSNIGTISGVLHQVPSDFVKRIRFVPDFSDSDGIVNIWHHVYDDEVISASVIWETKALRIRVKNESNSSIDQFAFAIDKNILGIVLESFTDFPKSLSPGSEFDVTIGFSFEDEGFGKLDQNFISAALRVSSHTKLFSIPIDMAGILAVPHHLSLEEYMEKNTNTNSQFSMIIPNSSLATTDTLDTRKIQLVDQNLYSSLFICLGGEFEFYISSRPIENDGIELLVKGDSRFFPVLQQNLHSIVCEEKN